MTLRDRARTRGPAALLSLGVVVGLAPSSAVAAPVTPSDDEARAARQAVASGQSAVARIEVDLARLSSARDEADVAARTAAEAYLRAVAERDAAAAQSAQASTRLQDAQASRESARRTLVAIAVQAGRSGGAIDGVEAFLSAEGFDDMVERSAALSRLGGSADAAVQRFRAAELVAGTLKKRADDAVERSRAAAARAEEAHAAAQRAEAAAQDAVAAAESQRESLIVQLAAARSTSAEIERARQDRVDAERAARADAAALAQRSTVPPPAAAPPPAVAPTPGAAPAPAAPAAVPAPARAPAPAPAPASAPAPAAAPPPAPAAAPAPAPAPAPATPGLGSGTSRGSAGQGSTAVAWGHANLGLEYVLGANGPTQYDCSSFTGSAWRSAGVNLPRTSRDQYRQTLKVAYDSLRPGDLIFWASDPADPSTIHHVAMYAGGGQVLEASRPGVPTRLASMTGRWANTMPYAGRP